MFDQLTTLLLCAYLAEVVLRIENSSIYIYTLLSSQVIVFVIQPTVSQQRTKL